MPGQPDIHIQKNNVGPAHHILYIKNNKMDYIPKFKSKTIKLLEGKTGVNLHDLGLGTCVLGITPKQKQPKIECYQN